MKSRIFFGGFAAAILACSVEPVFADSVDPVNVLPGYQCMVLSKLWDGEGPQPPPVHVFAGPERGSAQVGIAGGSVIVTSPLHVVDDRVQMLFADGRIVWIGSADIAPFHVVGNPHATCVPVLLSNGRFGFDTKH